MQNLEEGFASDPVVVDHTADGQHSQAPVLDLLQLKSLHFFLGLILLVSQRIKAKVSRDSVLVLEHGFHGNVTVVGPELKDSHTKDNLEHGRDSDRGGGEVGVINVCVSRDGGELLNDESNGGKHGGSSVLDLGLAEPLHVEVIGEAKGVETNISNVSLQVLGVSQERKRLGHFRVKLSANTRLGLRYR